MVALTLSEVAHATGGRLIGEDRPFSRVVTSSRDDGHEALFVALKGARFDGHDFVAEAASRGAVAALVSRQLPLPLPQVVVSDTLLALGQLGRLWRERFFSGRVVAVTGSSGKTTVKEMVALLVGGLKSEGNLNNEIGLPLTLLRLQPGHRFAVVEMGARKRGDLTYLAGIARPHLAILTGAGPAHLETFGSLWGVAEGKGELLAALPKGGSAVLNADDPFLDLWERLAEGRRIVRFGFSARAEVRARAVEPLRFEEGTFRNRFLAATPEGEVEIELRLAGSHNVRNALAAMAAALELSLPLERIRKRLARMAPVAGRLRPLRHLRGGVLLDDCYNANPSSFAAALEALEALEGEKWVVMGGLAELGEASRELHAKIGREMRQRGVEQLFAVGEETGAAVEAFGKGAIHFKDKESLLEALLERLHKEATLLVKGSRRYRLETIVQALCPEAKTAP